MSLGDKRIEEQTMSDTQERVLGVSGHKVVPKNRIKSAHRLSGTELPLKVWLKYQNGQVKEWAQQWARNKRG